MPKQIKIGFDRSLSPKVDVLEPLYDISGLPLRNENGEPLYTQEISSLESFYASKRALPVHVNDEKKVVKVVEQFPETSQVSSSLLGVPRAEEQLGLFSDVSTYGFDDNIWEFFIYPPPPKDPAEWRTRKNKTYGNRYPVRVREISEEQAISLQAFPTPWRFPFGPEFSDQGLYKEDLYNSYVRFIQLGRELYEQYTDSGQSDEFETFGKENFLSDVASVVSNKVVYSNNYTIEEVFEEIEKWTMTWIKLRNGTLYDPNNIKIDFPTGYDSNNTRPGYESNFRYYGQIESRKAFRYQPGRISGFTFGLRCSSDQASLSNIIEWGCANITDEYMFQVKGPNFSIVRRSTVPLPDQNLIDMGLTPEDQKLINPENPFIARKFDPDTGELEPPIQLYETVIPRDFFNNDRLDGNGPSGYILTVDQVTMYKIEFSWYGAIGAKFYAYVPIGNGDARWVLIHTLIIENKIGQPCLNDPYFKFKYVMNIKETSSLVAPQFVYKYGASYYIDGGDEGSSVSYSSTSEITQASPLFTRSALGVTAKGYIKNSDGVEIKNKKDIIPESISVTTDKPIRVDIIDCEGCPGFGHHYSQSLHNGQIGSNNSFTFSSDGTTVSYTNTDLVFTSADIDKKLIGDGIYSTYIDSVVDGNPNSAYIKRKIQASVDEPVASNNYTFANTSGVVFANGVVSTVKDQSFNLRLSGYNSVAASATPLTKPNIEINFLNPIPLDGRSYADFYIGITDKEPTIELIDNQLVFDNAPYDANNVLKGEWTNYRLEQDYRGYEFTESEERYGDPMEIDPQIPRPAGVDSGRCSKLTAKVTEYVYTLNETFTTATQTPDEIPGNYLVFSDSLFASLSGLLNGEIGIESGGSFIASGTKFDEDKATLYEIPSVGTRYYIRVNNSDLVGETKIVFRLVRIFGRYINATKVFSFDLYPLYVVVGMRDNSKVNNITIDEYDEISKFSYSPEWLVSSNSVISVVSSGSSVETLDPNSGLFISGGLAAPVDPGTNFIEVERLSSAIVDTQLQQPLRPGEIRSTLFLGADDNERFEMDYLFGQDRYLITPGGYNTKATFFTVKALDEPANTQITLNFKEQ